MNKSVKNQKGFSAFEALLIVVIVVLIAVVGYMVYKNHHKTTPSTSSSTSSTASNIKSTTTPAVNPYAGWDSSTSPRAKFSIKYPTSWTYAEQVGDKDGVEEITITGTSMQITIDSFTGTDATDDGSGGTTGTTCTDCQQTLSTSSFNVSKLGNVNLQTITYTLDNGLGNALILRQPDGTYYIASPTAAGVKSTFRAISLLNSEQDYQSETPAQFSANPDYVTAQEILKSVSY